MPKYFGTILQAILSKIEKEFSLFPVIGAELEFYTQAPFSDSSIELFKKYAHAEGLFLYNFSAEKGKNQYEISLPFTKDILHLAASLISLKALLQTFVKLHRDNDISFDAKPYADQPGSALHFHIHIEDVVGHNMCIKPNASTESTTTLYLLGGLLEAMCESMIYFAPSPASYARYKNASIDTPGFVCWGGNNRTVALRLPDTTHVPSSRRIEHRISSADACPYQALSSILAAMHYGLEQKIAPGEKIYGNAYDPHYQAPPYNLRALPKSFEEAYKLACQGKALRRYTGFCIDGEGMKASTP